MEDDEISLMGVLVLLGCTILGRTDKDYHQAHVACPNQAACHSYRCEGIFCTASPLPVSSSAAKDCRADGVLSDRQDQ